MSSVTELINTKEARSLTRFSVTSRCERYMMKFEQQSQDSVWAARSRHKQHISSAKSVFRSYAIIQGGRNSPCKHVKTLLALLVTAKTDYSCHGPADRFKAQPQDTPSRKHAEEGNVSQARLMQEVIIMVNNTLHNPQSKQNDSLKFAYNLQMNSSYQVLLFI